MPFLEPSMSLYRELPAAAQTAYAELYELVQVTEASRSPALVTGKVAYKTIKGSRYAYWAFKELDGRKREYSLGPDGTAIQARSEERSGREEGVSTGGYRGVPVQ